MMWLYWRELDITAALSNHDSTMTSAVHYFSPHIWDILMVGEGRDALAVFIFVDGVNMMTSAY